MKSSTTATSSNGVFGGVLYAQCWEDPHIDRAAFEIGPNDVVFTITSGGCNALTFLLDDPREVIALDLNPHQNYLLELKIAAIRRLAYDDLLGFMGVSSRGDRWQMYVGLRDGLSDDARMFWDRRQKDIQRGILHCGRFERYMRLLGGLTRLLVGRDVVDRMFRTDSTSSREALYNQRWSTRRWRLFTRIFLSRRFMTLLFDAAFFAQLEKRFSFGEHFEHVVRRALTTLPLKDSTFISYAFRGSYYDQYHLPAYLRRENIDVVRQRSSRVRIVTGDCGAFFRTLPARSISKFNFTNIFEWMPVHAFEKLLCETLRVARNGAVMTYRNLLVPRRHPLWFEPFITGRDEQSQQLHETDQSFIYRSYVIEDLHPEIRSCSTPSTLSIVEESSDTSSHSRTGSMQTIPSGWRHSVPTSVAHSIRTGIRISERHR